MKGHIESIITLDIMLEGKYIVTYGIQGEICVWDASTYELLDGTYFDLVLSFHFSSFFLLLLQFCLQDFVSICFAFFFLFWRLSLLYSSSTHCTFIDSFSCTNSCYPFTLLSHSYYTTINRWKYIEYFENRKDSAWILDLEKRNSRYRL